MSSYPESSTRLARRSFLQLGLLGAGALTLGLTGCATSSPGGGAGGSSPFSTKLGWIPDVAYSGIFIAQADGLYSAAGLDLTVEPGGPNSAVVPLVTAGRIDVGIESIPENVASAVNDGAALRIVGAGLRKSPECWVSLASNPIHEPRAIEGKRLGITLAGQNLAIKFMQRNGVDVDKVTLVPTQFDPAPLAVGEVDALWGFVSNQPVTLRNQGVETVVMPTADFGLNRAQQVFFASQDTLDDPERRERARQFLLATRTGTERMLADHARAAQVTVDMYGKDLGLVLADQVANLDALAPYVPGGASESSELFTMSDALVSQTLDSLDLIGVKADASLFTNELLTR